MDEILLSLGDKGKVVFSSEIIGTIAALALESSESELLVCDNIINNIKEKLSIKNTQRGIKISNGEGKLQVDVKADVVYGTDIPLQAKKAKANILEAVSVMTGIKIDRVNIHICGIRI